MDNLNNVDDTKPYDTINDFQGVDVTAVQLKLLKKIHKELKDQTTILNQILLK